MSRIDLLFALQVLIWLVALGAFLCSRGKSIFHPSASYLAFHLVVFIIRPILVHYYGFNHIFDRMGLTPSDDQQIRTLLVSSVSLVVFMVAGHAVGGPAGYATPRPRFSAEEILALKVTIILLLPLLAYSTLKTVQGIEITDV